MDIGTLSLPSPDATVINVCANFITAYNIHAIHTSYPVIYILLSAASVIFMQHRLAKLHSTWKQTRSELYSTPTIVDGVEKSNYLKMYKYYRGSVLQGIAVSVFWLCRCLRQTDRCNFFYTVCLHPRPHFESVEESQGVHWRSVKLQVLQRCIVYAAVHHRIPEAKTMQACVVQHCLFSRFDFVRWWRR
jgi:hypothetical protein